VHITESPAVGIGELERRLSEEVYAEKIAKADNTTSNNTNNNTKRTEEGRGFFYGAFYITSDQAEEIHALKIELKLCQSVKRGGNGKNNEIQWRGEEEVFSRHLAASGDLMYHKFLIAHDNDIQRAVDSIVNMVYARRELGLDDIADQLLANWNDEHNMLDFGKIEGGILQDTWGSFTKNCPFSDAVGVTKTNMEIKVFRPGFWDLKALIKEVDVEMLRRINMYKHEHFLLYSDKYCREHGAILRRCTLEDFTGFSFGPFQQWNMKTFRFVIFSELDPNYWPEEVGRLHAVYAPWLIGALLKFIKALNVVTPRTWESIRVSSRAQKCEVGPLN
jgi:hypothetical protein